MTLDNLIRTSYGIEDCLFALHDFDRERALKSLIVAEQEGVGFEEFIEKHREYLKSKNCSKEHIEKQIKKVKKIKSYFRLD